MGSNKNKKANRGKKKGKPKDYEVPPPTPNSGSRVALPAALSPKGRSYTPSSTLLGAVPRSRAWWTTIAVLGVLLLSGTLGLFIWFWFIGYVTTVAGTGHAGYRDGDAYQAALFNPRGIAIDGKGNIFVSDSANHCIRKIDPHRVISTLAGTNESGFRNGPGLRARFRRPGGVALGPKGALYIADTGNHLIRKLSPDGDVTTVAGSGQPGALDGPAMLAQFDSPASLFVTQDGTIYVADTENHRIRKISPQGQVITVAGNSQGHQDGKEQYAKFNYPTGVVLHPNGTLYVADSQNNRIRTINRKGQVGTLAGQGRIGSRDGRRYAATFYHPTGLALGKDGELYVSDAYNHLIRRVTTEGEVSTIAGNGDAGFRNGPPSWASFTWPQFLALGPSGNLFVAEWGNDTIRKISLKLLR